MAKGGSLQLSTETEMGQRRRRAQGDIVSGKPREDGMSGKMVICADRQEDRHWDCSMTLQPE